MPASLAMLVLATAACMIFNIPVPVIGDLPRTLLPDTRLTSINLEVFGKVIVPAISITLLIMIETLLSGEVGGRLKKEKIDTRQELIAQGAGNMIIPFFGGIPATGVLARTGVGIRSGGKTRLVSVFHAVVLILVIFAFAPIISNTPMSVLAGILIVTAIRMNDWPKIKFMAQKFLGAFSLYLITMIGILVLDLALAILIGVAFSCLMFIIKISLDTQVTIEKVDEAKLFNKHGIKIKRPLDFIRVVYLTGPIFFTTLDRINFELANLKDIKVLILSMRGVPIIDTSGIMEFDRLAEHLKNINCRLMLSGLQKPVEAYLTKSGLISKIGTTHVFWSTEHAIAYAQDLKGVDK